MSTELAHEVAAVLATLPQVQAVALGGSRSSRVDDKKSDIDLYVYSREEIAAEERRRLFEARTSRAEFGNAVWEPGDEWVDRATGVRVDLMYRDVRWIEEQLDRVLVRHEACAGYSTCFWYNVRNSLPLFDRGGWFATLQMKTRQPYPAELKRAIVAKNYPILRRNMSSYVHQIELALGRGDMVSANHRTAALLASYFDILFAINDQPHPGEKRLVQFAKEMCPKRPQKLAEQVEAAIEAIGRPQRLTETVNRLLDGLEELLRGEQLI